MKALVKMGLRAMAEPPGGVRAMRELQYGNV